MLSKVSSFVRGEARASLSLMWTHIPRSGAPENSQPPGAAGVSTQMAAPRRRTAGEDVQHPQPGSSESLALPPRHTGPPHPRPCCPAWPATHLLQVCPGLHMQWGSEPRGSLLRDSLHLPFGKASRAPRPNYPKRTVCGGVHLMDLPRTPQIQPIHCPWNRPKATSCYNLPVTICMSRSGTTYPGDGFTTV